MTNNKNISVQRNFDAILGVIYFLAGQAVFWYVKKYTIRDEFLNMTILSMALTTSAFGMAKLSYFCIEFADMYKKESASQSSEDPTCMSDSKMKIFHCMLCIKQNPKRIYGVIAFVSVVFSVYSGFFILKYGNYQFAAYDLSTAIDAGYRQYIGQKPYSDFICSLPPGFYLPLKYAFCLFGLKFDAILKIEVIFSCITFFWMCFLLQSITKSFRISIPLSLACQTLGVFIPCHWWHTSATSIIAGIYVCSAVLILIRRYKMLYYLSYGMALFCLVPLKPNVAVPMILGVSAIMVFINKEYVKVLITTLVTAVLSWFFLSVVNGIGIMDIVKSYSAIAGSRLDKGSNFLLDISPQIANIQQIVFYALILIPLVGYLAIANSTLIKNFKKKPAVTLLIFISVACGLFGCATSLDLKYSDFSLILISTCILPFVYQKENNVSENFGDRNASLDEVEITKFMKGKIYILCVCLAVLGITLGANRYRSYFAGPYFTFDSTYNNTEQATMFFPNLYSSAKFNDTLQQIGRVVDDNASKKFFFGTRLEFAYAAFNLKSPKNLPLWWQPGTSYSLSDEENIVSTWKKNRFDIVILNKGDLSCMPKGIINELDMKYRKDDTKYAISVYYRN